MSNRLESLTKKSNSKPSLKFKPKAVERKSKEERDKTVKLKQENEAVARPKTRGTGRPTRGRGGKHNNYAGTHVVSSGLFASGAVSVGNSGPQSTIVGHSISPSPEFIQSLKLKDKKSSSGSSDSDDEDDDLTKIDMNMEYRFDESETILFPVRPERYQSDFKRESTPLKEQSPVKEESPKLEDEPEFVKESSVKSENIETELQHILNTKADLESKIAQPVDLLDMEESEKLDQDRKIIIDSLTNRFEQLSTENKFTLIQLPKILPQFENKNKKRSGSTSQKNSPRKSIPQSPKTVLPVETKKENKFASSLTSLNGQVGSINFHKSGKISLNLGSDINLDLTAGVPSNFLQELVVLKMNEETETDIKVKDELMNDMEVDEEPEKIRGLVGKLGIVDGKLIATPVIT